MPRQPCALIAPVPPNAPPRSPTFPPHAPLHLRSARSAQRKGIQNHVTGFVPRSTGLCWHNELAPEDPGPGASAGIRQSPPANEGRGGGSNGQDAEAAKLTGKPPGLFCMVGGAAKCSVPFLDRRLQLSKPCFGGFTTTLSLLHCSENTASAVIDPRNPKRPPFTERTCRF